MLAACTVQRPGWSYLVLAVTESHDVEYVIRTGPMKNHHTETTLPDFAARMVCMVSKGSKVTERWIKVQCQHCTFTWHVETADDVHACPKCGSTIQMKVD